jgi:hypothetical protein
VFLFLGIGMWRPYCVAFVYDSFFRIACHVIFLINRDIWRGIFAALAVVSAGYLNFVLISFLVSAGVLLLCCVVLLSMFSW